MGPSARRSAALLAAIAVAVGVLAVAAEPASPFSPGMTERVSVPNPGLVDESNGHSRTESLHYGLPGNQALGPVLSGDGRFVAFTSQATNLVDGDGNGTMDVFVRDRLDGTTERVSVGTEGDDDDVNSDFPAISRDGNHVAFASQAPLHQDDTGLADWDVYVRDLRSDETVLISRDCDEEVCENLAGDQWAPAISGDGRYVAFADLTPPPPPPPPPVVFDPAVSPSEPPSVAIAAAPQIAQIVVAPQISQVVVHDRDFDGNGTYDDHLPGPPGVLSQVTTCAGEFGCSLSRGDDHSYDPSISDDGRWVAFTTAADNLVTGACGSGVCENVVVADRTQTDPPPSLTTVSRSIDGELDERDSVQPSISGDGRFVTFTSWSSNLLPEGEDSNDAPDVFLHDRDRNGAGMFDEPDGTSNKRISVTYPGGDEVDNGYGSSAISVDGTTVAFTSEARLVAQDVNGDEGCECPASDIYLYRLVDESLELVSLDDDGNQAIDDGNGLFFSVEGPAVSATGRHVAWESDWPFEAEDGNELLDVYVREPVVDLVITPDPVEFGTVTTGQASGLRTATVENVGGLQLKLSTIGVSAGGEFTIVDDTDCAEVVLPPDESCELTLRFTPAALGLRMATLSVAATPPPTPGAAAGAPVATSAIVQGRGAPVPPVDKEPTSPAALIVPDPVDFGTQLVGTPSAARTAEVRSVGTAALVVPAGGVTVGGPQASEFAVAGDGCGGRTLAPGTTCTVSLQFTPADAFDRSATLGVLSNAPSSPDEIVLRGAGVFEPSLVVNPAVGKRGSVTFATGSGYPPGSTVELRWAEGDSFINVTTMATADANGSFQTQMLVHGKDRLGTRHLIGTEITEGWTAEAPFLAELPTSGPPTFLIRG